MQIAPTIINEVIERSDLVEVIGRHLKIKRRGQNYFACCPFHNEKSASFAISPTKQIYHCFGCGESGNAINFLMKYLGLDFVSAVKSLASHFGVVIPEQSNQPQLSKQEVAEHKQRKLDLSQTLTTITRFYQQQLANTPLAQAYLQKRGLSPEVVRNFELGFAPASYQHLAPIFKDYATNPYLIQAGVSIEGESGRRYDRFRERIIFPIRNLKGDIIGFGGRIIQAGEPKYLNSPETELFNKSRELYGLFQAKKSIRDLNQVIVVEGYMDVIALNQYGITNVVATMGTAATDEHIKTLFRFCDTLCYSFDGDAAGKKAAWRALERSLSLVTDDKQVKFLFLPSEHDPDSYIRKYGLEQFKQQINQHSHGLITFLLNQLASEVNLASDEGKARLISLVRPYLDQLKAMALQVMLKRQLAVMVDLDPSVVESILNNRTRYAFYNRKFKQVAESPAQPRSPLDVKLLVSIIFALFNQPTLARAFPTPEPAILGQLDNEIRELFKLINYLELHCDDFCDIKLGELKSLVGFAQINLDDIYARVENERSNFTNVFTIDKNDYCAKLKHLVYGKKRKLPPKLD